MDRRTDRRTHDDSKYRASLASRDKNGTDDGRRDRRRTDALRFALLSRAAYWLARGDLSKLKTAERALVAE